MMLEPERYWREWLTTDPDLVMASLRETTHEDRAAWTFRAPEVKGGSPSITVDAELGLRLFVSRDDLGVVSRKTEVTTELDLSDEPFAHHGPWHLDPHHRYPPGWQPE